MIPHKIKQTLPLFVGAGRLASIPSSFLLTLSKTRAAPVVTIAKFEMTSLPRTSTRVSFDITKGTSKKQTEHISVYFCDENELADVAWTFAIPKGEDLVDVLFKYSANMEGDDYGSAFQKFVIKLLVQRSLQSQYSAPQKGIKLEKEAENASQSFGKYQAKDSATKEGKRGWSDEEIRSLVSLRKKVLSIGTIAARLGRTIEIVKRMLRELGEAPFKPMVEEGPQELPPELRESLFRSRLTSIWRGLHLCKMTPAWREALSKKSREQWLAQIANGIPEDVRSLLGGLRPPTYQELARLPPVSTAHAGVYARLVESRYEFKMAIDRYVYIGAASRFNRGLAFRTWQHTWKRKGRYASRLQQDIEKKHLRGPGRFVTLMVMEMNSSRAEHVLDVRRVVTLTEAILTVWLGALQSPPPQIERLCPWNSQMLDYNPWSSHNPLEIDVVQPVESSD